MKIILLGLEFYIGNRGCEALSFSFMKELNQIVCEEKCPFQIEAFVMVQGEKIECSEWITDFVLTKIEPKKIEFWMYCKKRFAESDLIVDFSMGDSFSDIYGVKRFIIFSILKELGVRSGTPFILGPQTYGPFQRRWVQKWASNIIKKSTKVYTRDGLSREYVKKICGRDIVQTTDVAFALPYKKVLHADTNEEKIKIGINVSGLLWQGGYTRNNQFHLKVDYREYCVKVIEGLLESEKYDIFLIPHVGDKAKQMMESDYIPCKELASLYQKVKLVECLESASAIKGEIAEMDVFIGARMHATIAAFSSGVATIPFSYSRKFEGLYQSLDYHYVIEAMKLSTDEAVKITRDYIDRYEELKKEVSKAMKIVEQRQEVFRKDMAYLIHNLCSGEKDEKQRNL